jgi:hypothetical protein
MHIKWGKSPKTLCLTISRIKQMVKAFYLLIDQNQFDDMAFCGKGKSNAGDLFCGKWVRLIIPPGGRW